MQLNSLGGAQLEYSGLVSFALPLKQFSALNSNSVSLKKLSIPVSFC